MPSMSLEGFIAHLGEAIAHAEKHEHHALEHAAKIVEAEAKREIGHYQEGAGPFGAWPELADRTQNDRSKAGFSPNDPGLRSGKMRDSIGHAVGHHEFVVGSNDDHMVYFELGTEKQPPRSVLGMAAVHKGAEVAHVIGQGVVQSLVGPGVFNGELPIP